MRALRTGATLGVMVLASAALALPPMVANFNAIYKVAKGSALDKAGCMVCHTAKGSPKLNPYGLDMKKALGEAKTKKVTADILKTIEALDSDKDGAKNLDEIKKDTNPGDPKSK